MFYAPRREVLLTALAIEIARMFMIQPLYARSGRLSEETQPEPELERDAAQIADK